MKTKLIMLSAIALSTTLAVSGSAVAATKTTKKKTTTKTTVKATTTLAPASAAPTTAAKAAGPIKYTVIGSFQSAVLNFPEVQGMFDARVKAVNEAGGVNGRKVEVTYCNDKFDANEAANCARKAVADGSVGVSSPITLFGSQILDVLEPAGVPYIASIATGATAETSSKVSFPMNGGSFVGALAMGQIASATDGCRIAGSISSLSSRTAGQVVGVKQAFEFNRGLWVGDVDAQGATDYAPLVAQVLSQNPDCLFALNGPADVPKLLTALAQSGKKVKIYANAATFPGAILSALPSSLTDGITLISPYATIFDAATVPEVSELIAETTKYGVSEKDQAGSFSIEAWAEAKLVLAQMKLIQGDVTAASMLAQMNKNVDPGTTLFGGPFALKPSTINGYTRVYNFNEFVYQIKNKALVLQRKVNAEKTAAAYKA